MTFRASAITGPPINRIRTEYSSTAAAARQVADLRNNPGSHHASRIKPDITAANVSAFHKATLTAKPEMRQYAETLARNTMTAPAITMTARMVTTIHVDMCAMPAAAV